MPEERGITVADLVLLDPDGAFPSRLAEDRAALIRLAQGLWRVPAEAKLRLLEIEALAHRLGGAAGTFGYEAVGAAALELEDRIAASHGETHPSRWHVAIETGLASLVTALDDALGSAA